VEFILKWASDPQFRGVSLHQKSTEWQIERLNLVSSSNSETKFFPFENQVLILVPVLQTLTPSLLANRKLWTIQKDQQIQKISPQTNPMTPHCGLPDHQNFNNKISAWDKYTLCLILRDFKMEIKRKFVAQCAGQCMNLHILNITGEE
jgi:hypothetical protein